jgi:hypothetical protein
VSLLRFQIDAENRHWKSKLEAMPGASDILNRLRAIEEATNYIVRGLDWLMHINHRNFLKGCKIR